MAKDKKKLTRKQLAFAENYIKSPNATQSAIDAGYSENTASEIGYENLNKPHIKEYIQSRLEPKEKKLIADADEVLEFLTASMRGEIKEEYSTPGGTVETAAKLRDRMKAAELIGKRHALFTEKLEIVEQEDDGLMSAIKKAVEDEV